MKCFAHLLAGAALVLGASQAHAKPGEILPPPKQPAPPSGPFKIYDERLDGQAVKTTRGDFMTCLVSGTYDPNAWDKNRYAGQPRDTKVADFAIDGAASVSTVEVVQWSWAERARCQQTLGTASANATAGLALAYILAADEDQARPKAFQDKDLTRLGLLVLLPVVMDDLRAVGPTRRYYTSAVLGTSLIGWRNQSLLRAATTLKGQPGPAAPRASCFIQPPTDFKVTGNDVANIQTLQAKVIVDIESYNAWCKDFESSRVKLWQAQGQADYFITGFQSQRSVRWQAYATLINTNGYQKQATTARVLHKFITLPATVLTSIVGDDKTEYELDNQPTINATDAVELPVLGGNYAIKAPDGNIIDIAYTLAGDLQKLSLSTASFAPSGKKAEKAAETARLTGDMQQLSRLQQSSFVADAVNNGSYWTNASASVAEINDLNARRYIILDIEAGTAYLSDNSVGKLKSSSPEATPAPKVEPKPAEETK